MIKDVMATDYLPERVDDIGYCCDVWYECPYCETKVEYSHLSLDFDDTIFFKTTARCTACKKECIVHNPNPKL